MSADTANAFRVILSDDRGETWRGTFDAFVRDQGDGMNVEEIREMAATLERGEPFRIGGGAAPVSTLRREGNRPAEVRTVELYPVPAGSSGAFAERLLNDCASSHWLRGALASALRRDPVDAAQDAELLLSVLLAKLEEVEQSKPATQPKIGWGESLDILAKANGGAR